MSATGGCRTACHQVSSVLNCNSLCKGAEVCVCRESVTVLFPLFIVHVCVKVFYKTVFFTPVGYNCTQKEADRVGNHYYFFINTRIIYHISYTWSFTLTADLFAEIHVWNGLESIWRGK